MVLTRRVLRKGVVLSRRRKSRSDGSRYARSSRCFALNSERDTDTDRHSHRQTQVRTDANTNALTHSHSHALTHTLGEPHTMDSILRQTSTRIQTHSLAERRYRHICMHTTPTRPYALSLSNAPYTPHPILRRTIPTPVSYTHLTLPTICSV
eukprot:3940600-Rhodomonas_salina.1